jgi:NAD(P)-dependent dehydrogenase (short-subunit alcohol dehydrogenase family)
VHPQPAAASSAAKSTRPVALVTGGSRGIGRAICVELAAAGYHVAINYAENAQAARDTQAQVESRSEAILIKADVGSTSEHGRLLDEVLTRWSRIDLLVNNAAITSLSRKDILEATEESWDRVVAVNLKGPYFLSQRVARAMIGLLPDLLHPAIINISSLSAYAASINRGDYCISKAGLSMATALFAVRLAEHGINVYEVRPGIVDTDMTAGSREVYDRLIKDGLTPMRRWGTPADVARAVVALATGQIPFSTGDVLNVDGGFHVRRL